LEIRYASRSNSCAQCDSPAFLAPHRHGTNPDIQPDVHHLDRCTCGYRVNRAELYPNNAATQLLESLWSGWITTTRPDHSLYPYSRTADLHRLIPIAEPKFVNASASNPPSPQPSPPLSRGERAGSGGILHAQQFVNFAHAIGITTSAVVISIRTEGSCVLFSIEASHILHPRASVAFTVRAVLREPKRHYSTCLESDHQRHSQQSRN
jgi:hypothetical protein